MKKNFLALSILLLPLTSTANEIDVYGRLWIAISNSENGTTTKGESGTFIENNSSRIGVKGKEPINNNFDILYQIETRINGMLDTDKIFEPRSTFIGINSPFGKLLIGRNNTVMKSSRGKAEIYASTNASFSRLISGQQRKGDSITYYSPKIFNVASVDGTYIFDKTDNSQYAINIHSGDKNLKKSNYFSSIAYSYIDDIEIFRLLTQVKVDQLKITGLYQKSNDVENNKEGDSYIANATYDIGKVKLKAEAGWDSAGLGLYIKNSINNKEVYNNIRSADINSIAIGGEYKLSRNSYLSLQYSKYSGSYTLKNTNTNIQLDNENTISFGLSHWF